MVVILLTSFPNILQELRYTHAIPFFTFSLVSAEDEEELTEFSQIVTCFDQIDMHRYCLQNENHSANENVFSALGLQNAK